MEPKVGGWLFDLIELKILRAVIEPWRIYWQTFTSESARPLLRPFFILFIKFTLNHLLSQIERFITEFWPCINKKIKITAATDLIIGLSVCLLSIRCVVVMINNLYYTRLFTLFTLKID